MKYVNGNSTSNLDEFFRLASPTEILLCVLNDEFLLIMIMYSYYINEFHYKSMNLNYLLTIIFHQLAVLITVPLY